jgi:hypothetical protein
LTAFAISKLSWVGAQRYIDSAVHRITRLA